MTQLILYDNFFCSLAASFGPELGQFLARIFGSYFPITKTMAEFYTPEYISSLGDAGLSCSIFTPPSLALLARILVFIDAAIVVCVYTAAILIFMGTAYVVVFVAINRVISELAREIDKDSPQEKQE